MHIFGVIRRQALARTGLQRNFYGTDKLILAELALLGRFIQIREKLYLKRFHGDMSWILDIAERRRWSNSFDAAYSLRLRQPRRITRHRSGKDYRPWKSQLALASYRYSVPRSSSKPCGATSANARRRPHRGANRRSIDAKSHGRRQRARRNGYHRPAPLPAPPPKCRSRRPGSGHALIRSPGHQGALP